MKKILLAGCIALAMAHGSAFAYDYTYTEEKARSNGYESFYAGASMGISGGDAGELCDDKDMSCLSWKAFAGYRASENLAFEAGYHNFIEDRSSNDLTQVKVTGLSASVLGIMPASKIDMFSAHESLEFFGKIGLAAWESKVDYARQTDGTDFLLGGGAQMKLGDNLGVRGDIEYMGSDIDSLNYSAGLTYSTY